MVTCNVALICITVIVCVLVIANKGITITIQHTGTQQVTPAEPIPDIDKVYEDISKEEHVPTFADVIDAINKEFGGLDTDE